MYLIVRNSLIRNIYFNMLSHNKLSLSGLAVFISNFLELLRDKCIDSVRLTKDILDICNILLKILLISCTVKNVLLIDISKLDLSNILSLDLIETGLPPIDI